MSDLTNGSHRPRLAPLIAIVGCDGSGKSTLAADLRAELARRGPAASCYLGLGSGALGQRIRRWPVVGPALERRLAAKAGQARSREARIPGPLTALVIFGFSLLRRRRFARALSLRRCGVTVVTDRYPQLEVAGFYDGPGLSAARPGGRFTAWLAARERALYAHMAAHRPDLVLRLNVDVATALARKPDHKPELLARKVEATPRLRFNGARIVDLDARAPYPEVRRRALEAVEAALAGRGEGGP